MGETRRKQSSSVSAPSAGSDPLAEHRAQLSYRCPATIFWDVLAALFGGSERLRNNRRMTDAAHNQHSENPPPGPLSGIQVV
jgi:hypothetical protein